MFACLIGQLTKRSKRGMTKLMSVRPLNKLIHRVLEPLKDCKRMSVRGSCRVMSLPLPMFNVISPSPTAILDLQTETRIAFFTRFVCSSGDRPCRCHYCALPLRQHRGRLAHLCSEHPCPQVYTAPQNSYPSRSYRTISLSITIYHYMS